MPRQQYKIGGPQTSHIIKLEDNAWMLYCDYLKQYSLRQLTNERDRVDAMMGILKRITRNLQCRLVHGLLSDAFEWCLSFDVSSCQRQQLFPSYSWAGWKGEVDTQWPTPDYGDRWRESDDDEDWRTENSGSGSRQCSDAKDDSAPETDDNADGDANGHGDSDSSSESPSVPEYDYHNSDPDSDPDPDSASASSGWTEKTAENVSKSTWIVWYERPPQADPRLINERDSLLERQNDIKALKVRLFNSRASIKYSVLQTQPTLDLQHLQTQLPDHYSVLQFWTISIKLCLRNFGVASAHRVDLVDAKEEWCGQLRLPQDLEPQYGEAAELILLATTDDHHILEENSQMFNGVESLGRSPRKDPSLPDFYRVMWIHRHGDLAERVAVGEIHYSALHQPVEGKIEWKEIILK
jgi:hypothetical protein